MVVQGRKGINTKFNPFTGRLAVGVIVLKAIASALVVPSVIFDQEIEEICLKSVLLAPLKPTCMVEAMFVEPLKQVEVP